MSELDWHHAFVTAHGCRHIMVDRSSNATNPNGTQLDSLDRAKPASSDDLQEHWWSRSSDHERHQSDQCATEQFHPVWAG